MIERAKRQEEALSRLKEFEESALGKKREAMNQFAIMFGKRFVPGLAHEQSSKKP